MGFFHEYPATDFHELNLDWILHQIMKLHKDYDEFKAVNTITNAGEWDITKQYQAWTIVSDNNTGYISLQPVPAGVAITNTDYWGLIADYNILITDLSNRISTLEGQMSTLLTYTIPALQRGYDRIRGKKIGVYADSWGGNFPEWIYQMWRNVGIEGFNHSYGGYRMRGIYENLVVGDTDTADIYLICGGINDWNGQEDPLTTVYYQREIIASIKAKSPNAEVYFLLPPDSLSMDSGLTENYCLEWYKVAIERYARNNVVGMRCSIIDCNLIPNFKVSNDGLHPQNNTEFLDYMGNIIAQFINDCGTQLCAKVRKYATDVTTNTTFYPNDRMIEFRPSSLAFSSGKFTITSTKFNSSHLVYDEPGIFHIPQGGVLKAGYTRPESDRLEGELMGYSGSDTITTYDTTCLRYKVIL